MTDVCLDTSTLVKWFYPEEDSDKALLILKLCEKSSAFLTGPDITSVELANSLLLGKGFGRAETINAITKLFSLEPDFITSDEMVIESVTRIAFDHKLTTYDSLFIAISELRDIPLFTADYKHHKKSVSKNIVWLKEWKGKL